MQNWTIRKIREAKNTTPLATITAYDAITGRLADAAGAALILVSTYYWRMHTLPREDAPEA